MKKGGHSLRFQGRERGESYWIGKNVQILLFNMEENFLLSWRFWCFPAWFFMENDDKHSIIKSKHEV